MTGMLGAILAPASATTFDVPANIAFGSSRWS